MANDISNATWSEVPSSNDASPPEGFSTSMSPASVAGSSQSLMAGAKKFWDRINATQTSTGSAGAYVVGYAVPPAALNQGEIFSWVPNFTSVGGDTLDVGLGAKLLYKSNTSGVSTLAAGDIVEGCVCLTAYDSTTNGYQILSSIPAGLVLPKSAGTMGQLLVSSGSSGSPATWSASGTTGQPLLSAGTSSPTWGSIPYGWATQTWTDTGSVNNLVITMSPAPLASQLIGCQITVLVANTNTGGACTLSPNGLTTPILNPDGSNLVAGQIIAGGVAEFVLTETSFQLLSISTAPAPLNSPNFSGTPTAPTASSGTNTTQIATTAFVASAPFAPLASPALTGTPTAPTAAVNAASTQIATTAFANPANYLEAYGYQKLPSGLIMQWGSANLIASESNATVTLPLPFPNAFFGATTTWNYAAGSSTAQVGAVADVNLYNFTIWNQGPQTASYYWMAWGV